jgi:hypothetical protein
MYVVPVLALFLILQRGFVSGISTSGLKQPLLPTCWPIAWNARSKKMNTRLSRRTALQAAGATVLAAGLSSGPTATAAHADGDNSAPKLVTYPRPATMPTNTPGVHTVTDNVLTVPSGNLKFLTTAEGEAAAAS